MRDRPRRTVSLLLTCLADDQCTVAFEPEGAIHVLRAGDWFEVEVSGGRGVPQIEVSYHPEGISIGAWSGAETHVRNRAGEDLPT